MGSVLLKYINYVGLIESYYLRLIVQVYSLGMQKLNNGVRVFNVYTKKFYKCIKILFNFISINVFINDVYDSCKSNVVQFYNFCLY